MGRFLKAVPIALLLFFTALPAQAANIPLFSPGWSIVPEACQACPCGVVGALQFIQNLMNAAISLGVIMFIFVIVYVGILFTLAPTNPEAKSKAKGLLSNAVIGFVIVLAGWLIVDYVMKFVYNPEAAFSGESIGPWNEIIEFKGTECIDPQDIRQIQGLPGIVDTIVNVGGGYAGGGGGGGGGPTGGGSCTAPASGACSVSYLQKSCFGSYASQAAQICNKESSNNPNNLSRSDKTADGYSYSVGLFQINLTNSYTKKVNGRDCSEAFSGPCQGSAVVQSGSGAGKCSRTVKDLRLYHACVASAQNTQNNIQGACSLNNNGSSGWNRWGTRKACNL